MTDERELVISELKRVGAMLCKNEQLFDLSVGDDETEALIYEHRALQIRYSALIKRAKELEIKGDELIWQK